MALSVSYFPLYAIKTNLLILLIFFTSCRKEETTIECIKIESGVNSDLTSITSFNDTLFITGNRPNHGQLLYSANGGQLWQIAGTVPHGLNNFIIHNNKWIAVADSFKIYTSDNSGQTWNELWIQGIISMEYITNIHAITAYDKNIYICGGNELGLGFIGTSTDNGNHWTFLQSDHELRSIVFSNKLNGVCCGYGVIYYTNDGGFTWNNSNQDGQFWTSVKHTNGYYFANSSAGTVISSVDGKKWNTIREGGGIFNNQIQLSCIAISNNNIISCGLNSKGIFSQDFGNNWKNIIFAENFHIYSIYCNGPNEGFIAGENGRLYKINY